MLGERLPLWTALPFGLLLACIAVVPLLRPQFWERNHNKALVSFGLGGLVVAWLGGVEGAAGLRVLGHTALDYLSFIALLTALFVISGGIYLRGRLAGTPLSNAALLGVGAVLASLIGTTGASVILIRPLLRAAEHRRRRTHLVIFLIFIVSNCGGLLTPLGDPPLFLGFLKGVPFEWTLRLWPQWLFVNGLLLAVFVAVDRIYLVRDGLRKVSAPPASERLGLQGGSNLLLLAGVLLVVVARGEAWGTGSSPWPFGLQEALMLGLAAVSWFTTPTAVREANRFTFAPIVEVAVLFAGIFASMIAPLEILNAQGSRLGLVEPWHYFWATGSLSSFLDNAPTYLTFAAAAAGSYGISVEGGQYLQTFLARGSEAASILAAISCGAVLMGANTYIGNGPNFLVKAIAEENGVRMPSFLGYMAYSGAILIPIFVLATLLFFR